MFLIILVHLFFFLRCLCNLSCNLGDPTCASMFESMLYKKALLKKSCTCRKFSFKCLAEIMICVMLHECQPLFYWCIKIIWMYFNRKTCLQSPRTWTRLKSRKADGDDMSMTRERRKNASLTRFEPLVIYTVFLWTHLYILRALSIVSP